MSAVAFQIGLVVLAILWTGSPIWICASCLHKAFDQLKRIADALEREDEE